MASSRFEELDWRPTFMGELSLRRRREPTLGIDIYEIKLDDEFLMSSLFTVAEIELARLGLAELSAAPLDVVVGGLGLGYTARAVLDDPRVGSLTVIDAIEEVIDWHRTGLLPLGPGLSGDPRCRLVHGDFFAMAQAPPTRLLHAVLVDIDHAPGHVLHPGHQPFYTPDGLRALAAHLRPGGVFGLWSDDPPDQWFLGNLEQVFSSAQAHVVTFPNPLRGVTSANTVYLARSALA